jgi:hypothetical protein
MNNLPESHQTPTIKLYHWVVIIFTIMVGCAGLWTWFQNGSVVNFADSLIGSGLVGFFLAAWAYLASGDENPEMRQDQHYRHIMSKNTKIASQYNTSNWQFLDKMLFSAFVAASLNVGLGMLIHRLIS